MLAERSVTSASLRAFPHSLEFVPALAVTRCGSRSLTNISFPASFYLTHILQAFAHLHVSIYTFVPVTHGINDARHQAQTG